MAQPVTLPLLITLHLALHLRSLKGYLLHHNLPYRLFHLLHHLLYLRRTNERRYFHLPHSLINPQPPEMFPHSLYLSLHLHTQHLYHLPIRLPHCLHLPVHHQLQRLLDLSEPIYLCEPQPFISQQNSTFLTVVLLCVLPDEFSLFVIMNITN